MELRYWHRLEINPGSRTVDSMVVVLSRLGPVLRRFTPVIFVFLYGLPLQIMRKMRSHSDLMALFAFGTNSLVDGGCEIVKSPMKAKGI